MSEIEQKWAVIQDMLMQIGLTPEQAKRAAIAAYLPEPTSAHLRRAWDKRLRNRLPNRGLAALIDVIGKEKDLDK
jgi:hypothetical protein